MADFAVSYVKKFHAIVPVGAWKYTNKNGDEVELWKKPLIKAWASEPLRTEKQVRDFWEKEAEYGCVPGVALATGQICGGYIVMDCDSHPERGVDGYEVLKDWERKTGKHLPEDTWTAISGSGGYHFYFRTDRAMRSFSNDKLGVDLRADGGCIILPPSLHPNGRRYQWEYHPADYECAEATNAVYDFLDFCRPTGSEYRQSTRRGSGGERKMVLPPVIGEGGRHRALVSAIGSLNRLGVSDSAIIEVIRRENSEKCKPPLSEEELQREIFPAVYRWDKGVSTTDEWKSGETWKREQRKLWKLERERNRLS